MQLLTTKRMLLLVNMSSRDYLRQQYSTHPTVLSIQQAVELHSGGDSGPAVSAAGAKGSAVVDEEGGSVEGSVCGSINGGRSAENEVFPVSLQLEESIREIFRVEGPAGVQEYFAANPTHNSAVPMIIAEAHRALGLIHFYTTNEREVKCWCLRQGKTILESSAVVDVNITRYAWSFELLIQTHIEMWVLVVFRVPMGYVALVLLLHRVRSHFCTSLAYLLK